MSEYYMNHTGAELDEAINKVKSGYIMPSETINIIENVNNMDIKNGKILNVNVPVPSGYIKTSDTKNYTTRFAAGSYTPSSDTMVSNVSINTIGFKPKIFVIRNNSAINISNTSSSTATRYYVVCIWYVADNNYSQNFVNPSTSANVYAGFASGIYSQSNQARSLQSGSANNNFTPTDTGVKGTGATPNSPGYFKSNVTYNWYAWG